MISIIGTGRVGSAIAFLCTSSGLDDVLLVNRTEKKAIGEALDLANTIPTNSSISVMGTGDYSKIVNSDVVVIAASIGEHSTARTDMMSEHTLMIKKIMQDIAKFAPESKVLIVTNPVDVLTFVASKYVLQNNTIGVASSLDSSRFRYILAQEFGTDQSQITDALVLGEHDDSMVPIFSHAKFGGIKVTDLLDQNQIDTISSKVRFYWKDLRSTKGSSVYGIAKNTFDVISAIINNKSLEIPVSVYLDGQYGLENLCMGVPTTINKHGITKIHEIPMTQNEKDQLYNSASIIKNNITKAEKLF